MFFYLLAAGKKSIKRNINLDIKLLDLLCLFGCLHFKISCVGEEHYKITSLGFFLQPKKIGK